MQQSKTLYQKSISGKIICWRITQDNAKLTYEWGFENSPNWQIQHENVNGNRIGTKAEKTPTENAAIIFDRTVKNRIEAGYFESKDKAIAAYIDIIDFDNIPTSFCAPKPRQQKPTQKTLDALDKSNTIFIQRKANGIRAHFVRSQNRSYLFTREWKNCEDQFPQIYKEMQCLVIPDNSIVDLEITIDGGYTQEQFQIVSSMAPNTDKKTAAEIYRKWLEKHPRQKLCAIILDVIYWEGIKVLGYNKFARGGIIYDFLQKRSLNQLNENNVRVPECQYYNLKGFIKRMEKEEWEGLVVWDLEMTSDITLNGKPSRPKGCWKWVNTKKADCIITKIVPEKGNDTLVGSFEIAQYNKWGNLIDCGSVASGLDDAQKIEAWDWMGKVIEIKYKSRHPTNKKGQRCFNLPVFLNLRKDKSPKECIIEE